MVSLHRRGIRINVYRVKKRQHASAEQNCCAIRNSATRVVLIAKGTAVESPQRGALAKVRLPSRACHPFVSVTVEAIRDWSPAASDLPTPSLTA